MTLPEMAPAQAPAEVPVRARWRGTPVDRLEVLVPTLTYIALSLTGITTSSLGYDVFREDPSHPIGFMVGEAQKIRSDEWRTATPIELGVLARGTPLPSPLSQGPDLIYQVPSGSTFESLLFFDGNLLRLGRWFPEAVLFAAFRWLPIFLFVLCLPPLMRLLGASRAMSWLAVGLSLAAPATAWWSLMPIRILGYATAGCYLLVIARNLALRRRWATAVLVSGLAGICTARLVGYYPPWGIVLGMPLVLATCLYLVHDRNFRRIGLAVLLVGSLVGAMVLGMALLENAEAFRAELNTIYPGLRRAHGTNLDPFLVFGAPGLFVLQGATPPVVTGTNYSEMTSSWSLAAAWSLVLAVALWPHRQSLTYRVASIFGVTSMMWILWCLVPMGDIGTHIPLMNLVTPARAAQTLGYPALFATCLLLSLKHPLPHWAPSLAAAITFGVTFIGLVSLRTPDPTYRAVNIVAVPLVVAAIVWALSRPNRSRSLAVGLTVLLAGLGVWRVNPLIRGFGDLRDSAAAHIIQDYSNRAEREGGRVLGDTIPITGLVVANGGDSLTGYQVTGPVRSMWKILDPVGKYESEWNRGASYLRFELSGAPGSEPVITTPYLDNILVTINGCDAALREFQVKYLFSASPIAPACFHRVDTFRWSGKPAYVYAAN